MRVVFGSTHRSLNSFNADSTMLATTSNHSTCHIFKLNDACKSSSKVEEPAGGDATGAGAGAGAGTAAGAGAGAGSAAAPASAPGAASGAGSGSGGAAGAGSESKENTVSTYVAVSTWDAQPLAASLRAVLWCGFIRFSRFKNYLPKYFASEWNFAKCKVPDGVRTICAFGSEPNTIICMSRRTALGS